MPAETIDKYKIVITGQQKAGKTELVNQEIRKILNCYYIPTIGVNFMAKTYHADTSNKIRLQMYDLAGDERYDSVTQAHFQGAHAAIICVSLEEPINKAYLNKQIAALRDKASSLHITLVGTKADLIESHETAQQLQSFAKDNDCDFACVSAEKNEGVNELFQGIINELRPVATDIAIPKIPLSPLLALEIKIHTLPQDNDSQIAFQQALIKLATELDKNLTQLKDLDTTNKTIAATNNLLIALEGDKPKDAKTIFQTYQNDCSCQSSSLLSKLIKIVVITGLCAAVGAVLTAGILGLSLGIVVGVSASVGAVGLLSSSIAFFKKNDFEKALDTVIKTGKKTLNTDVKPQPQHEEDPFTSAGLIIV